MESRNMLFNLSGPRQLILKRLFPAPVALVFHTWTDPRLLGLWWGPHGFHNPACTWEAKPNGHIYIEMTEANGTSHPMGGIFHEVDELRRLLFTTSIIGDDVLNPPLKVLNAVKFTDIGGQTEVYLNATVQCVDPKSHEYLRDMERGWCQRFDKLEELLAFHTQKPLP